jgi:hypothetical protein
VKLLFNTRDDLVVTTKAMQNAVFSHRRELAITEYLLNRCNLELITRDVRLTASRCWSFLDKIVTLLKHNSRILILDKILIVPTHI